MLFDKTDEFNIKLSDYENISKTVYLYIEPQTNKKFVLKVEQSEEWTNSLDILKQEFRKLVHLSDEPEIATVNFLVKVDDRKIGYLMEYVDGIILKEYLNIEKITYEKAFDILSSIIKGLDKAHSYGISHQDLHCNNIMIDKRGYIKIIDFLDMKSFGFSDDFNSDIKDIKKIAQALFDKIEDTKDKRRFNEILSYINSIKSLKDVYDNLVEINQILDELIYYNPLTFRVFKILIENLKFKDDDFLFETLNFQISLNDFEDIKKQKEDWAKKYILKDKIQTQYKTYLLPLISLNFIQKPIIKINKIENNIVDYSISIFYTPKLLKTKEIISKYNLFNMYQTVNDIKRTLHDFVFKDTKELLTEKNLILYLLEKISESKV